MDGGREGGRPERHDDFGEELAIQEEGKKKGPTRKKNGRGMVVRSGVWGKGGDEKKKKNRNKGRLGDFADC